MKTLGFIFPVPLLTQWLQTLFLASLLLLMPFLPSQGQTLQWTEVVPGVWKAVAGQPDDYDLLKAAGVRPNQEALAKMAKADFPLPKNQIVAEVKNGQTSLRFPLQVGEQVYGFGLNFKTVHQRGRVLQLHVDHYGKEDNGRTHAPVPFYVSGNGYGVFINSARYINVWAGTGIRKDSPVPPKIQDRNTDKNWSARPYSDAVEMLIPAGGTEIYVFAGPTPLDAVRRYNLFNGGGCLPPRWGLGFVHRTPLTFNSSQVLAEADEFRKRGFPLDVIGLEPGWQSKSYPCTFAWDPVRFPQPAAFVKQLTDQHIRVNLWTNPYVSPESPVYADVLPYSGSHTVWNGIVPDLTLPQVVQAVSAHFQKNHLDVGVSGYKIDECDGYDHYLWPDVATFPSGISASQMRQTYGLLLQKETTDWFRNRNQRTYGLIRASNGGASAYPYVLYNDSYSHEDFITALCNSSFSGILWTPEVRGSKTAEEWLRRMQSVCFSPMAMLNAWASGTKPWSFPEVEKQVKEIAQLRMQLMPYFYTEFARYHFEGTPPFRSMNLEAGFNTEARLEVQSASLNDNPYTEAVLKEVKDQYMAGEFLLVAPLFAGQTSRRVILPRGKWYDFYTGAFAGEGEVVTVTPGLDKIPVFVKDGGIIPMMEARLHAPEPGEKVNLQVRHYGQKTSSYLLYDDDGETFNYEKGQYAWRELKVARQKDGKLMGSAAKVEKGKPNTINAITWKFMTNP